MRLARTRLTAAAVTIAALTLGVSACGGDSEGSSARRPGRTSRSGRGRPSMEEVVDIWNEANPDIQVTVNKQDGGDAAVTKLLTAIKAGSGAPDIMQAEYQASRPWSPPTPSPTSRPRSATTSRATSPTASGTP